jgi:hypothetical protein
MPTITEATLVAETSRAFGLVSFATTTNITTSVAVVSTSLSSNYSRDDFFIGNWFIIIRGTNNNETIRRIVDYAATSGTLSVSGASLASESGSVNCELHRFDPLLIRDIYTGQARHELLPQLGIVRDHQSIVTGQNQHRFKLPTTLKGKPLQVWLGNRVNASAIPENEITDPGFEDWASTTSLTSWTLAGTGSSVNQETDTTTPKNYNVLSESNSARLLSNASDETTLLQTVTPTVSTQRVEANFSVWVYSTQSALAITARVGGTDGTAHTGTGWERLTATVALGEATTVACGVAVATGTAFSCYVDEAILILGQSEPVDTVWEPLLNWDWVPPVGGASDNGYIYVPYDLPAKRRLRILGTDALSTVTSDSGTIELRDDQMPLLLAYLRWRIAEREANEGYENSSGYWRGQEGRYHAEYESLMSTRPLLQAPKRQISIPDWRY